MNLYILLFFLPQNSNAGARQKKKKVYQGRLHMYLFPLPCKIRTTIIKTQNMSISPKRQAGVGLTMTEKKVKYKAVSLME